MAQEVQKLEGDAITQGKKMHPADVFRADLTKQKSEFQKVLPNHISFEKFHRTVMTAIIHNPVLLTANRQSLLVACLKAATDGLLPDQRDAALVTFKVKAKDNAGKDIWIDKVQYLPMYSGILKKVRQSGDIVSIVTHVVYEADKKLGKFEYVLGDNERIVHEPYIGNEPRGAIIAAYCIAKLKDGTVVREVMTFQDIEKVRKTSKSGSMNENDVKWSKENPKPSIGDPKGIWKAWYEEMARKTVFRRAAKWLPQQIEIVDQAFQNDASMDVIDSVAENAAVERITEDGEVLEIEDGTADDGAQPDLKEKIKEKKEAAQPKAEKKSKAEVKKSAEIPTSNEEENLNMAENEEQNQDDGGDVSRETAKSPDAPLTTIERIVKACENSLDGIQIQDVWEKFAADIGAIKRNNKEGYATIMDAKVAAEKRVAGTEA